jgi:hypothetical protein
MRNLKASAASHANGQRTKRLLMQRLSELFIRHAAILSLEKQSSMVTRSTAKERSVDYYFAQSGTSIFNNTSRVKGFRSRLKNEIIDERKDWHSAAYLGGFGTIRNLEMNRRNE